MSRYIYTFHRFDDRSAFLSACHNAGFTVFENEIGTTEDCALDDIGALYEGGDFDGEGNVITPPTLLPGYHVNMAWKGEVHPAFQASLITPKNPKRLWL